VRESITKETHTLYVLNKDFKAVVKEPLAKKQNKKPKRKKTKGKQYVNKM
jgi:hypothetical protein